MLTKGAIGNLINRYTAVLKKCNLINTFGSLAVASMLVLGGAGVAEAAKISGGSQKDPILIEEKIPATDGIVSGLSEVIAVEASAFAKSSGITYMNNNLNNKNSAVIYNKDGGTLNIEDCIFRNNSNKDTTKSFGGAIDNRGTLYVTGSTPITKTDTGYEGGVQFISNSSYSSGAVNLYGSKKATFSHVLFEGNTSGMGGGGAIKIGGGTASFTDAYFIGNYANGIGGAVYVYDPDGLITFKDSYFEGNRASAGREGSGGAIAVYTGTVNFEGTNTFVDNRAFVNFDGNTGLPKPDTGKPNDISNSGTIYVKAGATLSLDGGITGSGTLTFESGSTLLVEDASKLNDRTTPLISDGTLTVDSGAKLKLNKAVSGETYRIADKLKSGSYWTSDNIILTSLLLEGEAKVDADDKGFTVEVSTAGDGDIAAALPGVIPVLALSESVDSGIDTGSNFMGRRFLSRATDTDYLPVKAAEPATAEDTTPATPPANRAATYSLRSTRATPGTTASTPATTASTAATAIGADLTATAVKLINEVARAAVTVGVQNTALRISDAAADLNLDHLSLANHNKASSFHSGGSDFWAAPLYGNLYSSGMTLNSDSVRGQFGGLALGADTEIGQIAGGKVRLGAALHGGGGQSETKGTLTTSQNDYDFGGLSFYAGWNKGAFNLIGSLGYGFGNHEVEMALPSSIDMGVAKADIDTTAFTADLRAEYELKAGWLNVVPHVGLRYTMLKTDAHELSVPGGVMTEFAADTQNIVQFPIGVALSADTTLGGWTVKPGADFSFIPACGETDAYTRMHFTGVDAWDSVNSRIMDSTSYAAELSLKAEKGNFSLGLSYGVQASSHETDQNIQFKLGWKF